MKITIYGAGYVGLVTGTCFAEVGNHVVCVDINKSRVEQLNAGICPIHEPGLPELIERNVAAGRLRFTSDHDDGIEHGFFQFIAVGTPQSEDGSADISAVLKVAEHIGSQIQDYRLLVMKSTVPVGTSHKVKNIVLQQLEKRHQQVTFDVASNPEFLREGAAIDDFMNSDRIVIGTERSQAAQHLSTLYGPFNRNHDRLISMDICSAELTKYAANAMLATKISFINEMSCLAEHLGADIEQVRIGIGADPRIGYHFINPGCGYGGSCFPKDIRALEEMARAADYHMTLIDAVDKVNVAQKQVLFEKIKNYFNGDLKDKVIALWGLSFKPNTDDLREASSLSLLQSLWHHGAKVQAYDPVSMQKADELLGARDDLTLVSSPEQALYGADALCVVTEWNVFFSPDFENIKSQLSHPVIFDGRNLYDPAHLADLGIHYYGIGRGLRHEDS